MIKKKYYMPSCATTAGRPFEDGPSCPLYTKTNKYLTSNGWRRVSYSAFKTGAGDLCNTKYKIQEMAKDSGVESEVVRMLEVHIEGTDVKHGSKCTLTAILWTYLPENILASIEHESESKVMEKLDLFFNEQK